MTDAAEVVRVSIEVPVSPERAFQVFTEQIDLWWKKGPRFRFESPWEGTMFLESGVNGRFLHVSDDGTGHAFEIGRVRVWEVGRRLVLSWRLPNFEAGQETEVEILFDETARGTRVSVEHRGWETIPIGHAARHGKQGVDLEFMRGQNWAEILKSFQRVTILIETKK